jgi:hypothetical protein
LEYLDVFSVYTLVWGGAFRFLYVYAFASPGTTRVLIRHGQSIHPFSHTNNLFFRCCLRTNPRPCHSIAQLIQLLPVIASSHQGQQSIQTVGIPQPVQKTSLPTRCKYLQGTHSNTTDNVSLIYPMCIVRHAIHIPTVQSPRHTTRRVYPSQPQTFVPIDSEVFTIRIDA